MTRRLTPRHRRTRLGLDVGRAAGFYEQCDHRSSSDEALAAPRGAHAGSLAASGMVERPGRLGPHVLRSLAGSDRLSDFDARVISIADLLSEFRLDAEADLIMWDGVDGSKIATPIARLFDGGGDGDGSTLLLGGRIQTAQPQWTVPVILRSSSLPNHVDMEVVALSAMTFTQFVGGER